MHLAMTKFLFMSCKYLPYNFKKRFKYKVFDEETDDQLQSLLGDQEPSSSETLEQITNSNSNSAKKKAKDKEKVQKNQGRKLTKEQVENIILQDFLKSRQSDRRNALTTDIPMSDIENLRDINFECMFDNLLRQIGLM